MHNPAEDLRDAALQESLAGLTSIIGCNNKAKDFDVGYCMPSCIEDR